MGSMKSSMVPPQHIPRSCAKFHVRSCAAPLCRASRRAASTACSMAPPPTVPRILSSGSNSSFAPGCCGVEPDARTTVARAPRWPLRYNARSASVISRTSFLVFYRLTVADETRHQPRSTLSEVRRRIQITHDVGVIDVDAPALRLNRAQ